jgi:hypothetical protein
MLRVLGDDRRRGGDDKFRVDSAVEACCSRQKTTRRQRSSIVRFPLRRLSSHGPLRIITQYFVASTSYASARSDANHSGQHASRTEDRGPRTVEAWSMFVTDGFLDHPTADELEIIQSPVLTVTHAISIFVRWFVFELETSVIFGHTMPQHVRSTLSDDCVTRLLEQDIPFGR